MLQVLAKSELLFGNETEAEAFAEKQELGTKDVKEIAMKIAAMPLEGSAKRRVIITQGAEAVIVATAGEDKVQEFPVQKLDKADIVDTNGAGDAFVGGYLAQLALGADLPTCVRCGVWAATEIIRRSGCTFPDKMEFK